VGPMMMRYIDTHWWHWHWLRNSFVLYLFAYEKTSDTNDLYCVEWGVKLYSLTYLRKLERFPCAKF